MKVRRCLQGPSSRYPGCMLRRIMLLWLVLYCVAMPAQSTHPATGREIAPVMGIGGADWLVRSEREAEEAPDRALDAIVLKKGEIVADIGAGVGYFTWRMAERVGPAGKVYASDIQPGMLEQLQKHVAVRGLVNVVPVLGSDVDPKLPAGKLD